MIPLSKPETEMWTGIWRTCDLMSIPVVNENESCIFRCHCLGGCEEIQITKRPRKAEENPWSLCRIDVIVDRSGGVLFYSMYVFVYDRVNVCEYIFVREQAQSINISKHPLRPTSINININTTIHTLI